MYPALLILAMVAAFFFIAIAVAPRMADVAQIGPPDSQLALQASVTKTATFAGTTIVDLGSGFAPAGAGLPMQASVNVTALDTASGNETYSFVVEHSSDNSTYVPCSEVRTIAATGAYAIGCFPSRRYVRLTATLGGTTPSLTYLGYLSPLHV